MQRMSMSGRTSKIIGEKTRSAPKLGASAPKLGALQTPNFTFVFLLLSSSALAESDQTKGKQRQGRWFRNAGDIGAIGPCREAGQSDVVKAYLISPGLASGVLQNEGQILADREWV